jgi:multidrug resistance efflux pump
MLSVTLLNLMLASGEPVAENGKSAIPTDIVWIFAIIFLGLFMMLATWRRVRRSQAHDQLTVQERVSNVMPKADGVYTQINDLMTELADLSRQINGQIDTRIAKLDLLNAQADETINHLQRLLEDTQAKSTSGQMPATTASVPKEVRRSDAEPNQAPIESQETRNILNWANQGRSPVSIAQELNRPVGEIELILALNKK